MTTAYDPETCVTAGELRAAGIEVPENIPDVGWVPRDAVVLGDVKAVRDANALRAGRLTFRGSVTFTEQFRWVECDVEIKL